MTIGPEPTMRTLRGFSATEPNPLAPFPSGRGNDNRHAGGHSPFLMGRGGRRPGLGSPSRLQFVHELVEEVLVVLGTGAGLRVVLDGEDGQRAVRQALDRAVVQVDVADFEPAARRD